MTFQEENWASAHGDQYTERNPQETNQADKEYLEHYGISRTNLNKEFLGLLDKQAKILEIGCNAGVQLAFLQEMGFKNLYGIDINLKALQIARKNLPQASIVFGSAFDAPFKDGFFDLVFTSGVLIHIAPKDIKQALSEVARCSKKYIWGFEYFAEKNTDVNYRGKDNLLWKANFPKLYLETIKGLKIIEEKKLKYLKDDNIDVMFLLEKYA